VGREFWVLDDDAAGPVGGRRREAHDFGFGFSIVGETTGGESSAGIAISSFDVATVSTFGDSGDAFPLVGEAAAIDNEVLVDRGDPGIGVSGAVEHAGVVSVADEEGISACSGDVRIDSFNSSSS